MGQAKWHKPDTSLLFFEELSPSPPFSFFSISPLCFSSVAQAQAPLCLSMGGKRVRNTNWSVMTHGKLLLHLGWTAVDEDS